jgi:peptide-methionine (S)-S-oxide reductase
VTSRFLAPSVALAVVFAISIVGAAQEDPKAAVSQDQPKAASRPAASRSTAVTPGKSSPVAKTSASAKARSKSKKAKTGAANSGDSESESASSSGSRVEYATFGAGCFWHVEATFERLPGVISAVSGYAGGFVRNPSYEMVHEGDTGHAEVVMIEYDPDVITYEQLLKVFWSHHDPTTPNQQGPDIGPQYRSIILYHNEAQREAALESYRNLVQRRVFRNPIVTQLAPLKVFYRAEDYHQDYYGGKPRTTAHRRKTTVSTAKKPTSRTKRAPTSARTPALEKKPESPQPADDPPSQP